MKKILDKLSPEWVLRISLGLMYLFSGTDLFKNPKSWYWAAKPLGSIVYRIGIDNYLKMQGVGELVLAAILIFKFMPRILVIFVAGLTVIEMALILLLFGVNGITFRDIGLLGAALALYLILTRKDKPMDEFIK